MLLCCFKQHQACSIVPFFMVHLVKIDVLSVVDINICHVMLNEVNMNTVVRKEKTKQMFAVSIIEQWLY